jgi:hypothetical protein
MVHKYVDSRVDRGRGALKLQRNTINGRPLRTAGEAEMDGHRHRLRRMISDVSYGLKVQGRSDALDRQSMST